MVASVRILSSTRLTGNLHPGQIGLAACAAGHSHAHTLGNVVIPVGINGRYAAVAVLGVNHCIGNLLHHMWRYKPAAVGDCGAQVGDLQGGCKNLTLPYRHRYDSVGTPVPLAIHFVVELGVGDETAPFVRKVHTELVSVTHGDKVVFPHLESLVGGAVLRALVDHRLESPAEICVA